MESPRANEPAVPRNARIECSFTGPQVFLPLFLLAVSVGSGHPLSFTGAGRPRMRLSMVIGNRRLFQGEFSQGRIVHPPFFRARGLRFSYVSGIPAAWNG